MNPGEQQSHQMLTKASPRATTTSGSELASALITRWQQGRLHPVRVPTRTMTQRSQHRLTQSRLNDPLLKIEVIPLPKARTIAIGSQISFRHPLGPTFYIRSR